MKIIAIRAVVLVGLVLAGCSKRAPVTTPLPNGSATYGGATYGGATDDTSATNSSAADGNGGAVEPREPRPNPDGDPSGY